MWSLGVLAVVLVVAAVVDVWKGKIYNVITLPAIAVGLIGHAMVGGVTGSEREMGLAASAAGLATGFLPLMVAWMAGGIGGGDAKLMAAVGALAGWRFALATMFYGFLIAALMAIIVMLKRRIAKRTMARIFRFLYLVFTPARPADPVTDESPKIPFGLALCIGAAAALVLECLRGAAAPKWPLGF
jgi:prepilin peptidase CpaA